MSIFAIFSYFVLAILLFFLLNWIDRKCKNDNLVHIVFPLVYIFVVAGFFSTWGFASWNALLYLVVGMELGLRLFYVHSVLGRDNMVNTRYYLKIYSISIVGSFFLSTCLLSKVSTIFPSSEELRWMAWIFVFLFIYYILKHYVSLENAKEETPFIEKRQEYALMQYARLKNHYAALINFKEKEPLLVTLVYAVMVYQNYKRPEIFRKIDLICYRFQGKEMPMGIMQILSKVEIDDSKSIKLSISKVEKLYLKKKAAKKKAKPEELIPEVIAEYFSDPIYQRDVLDIYQVIRDFDQK